MSSIYGKINFILQGAMPIALSAMHDTLNHWIAEDSGQWHQDNAGLGHLMLYNTPESLHEKLPLHNSKKGLTITADARIDNREELFLKLYPADVNKTKVPDSTLILKAYEKYGEDCVLHLIGDFTFAIWDEPEQTLFCARDHMGVKPFFYYHDDHFFAFASEKKGLLALRGLNKEVNENYLLKITGNISPSAEETVYTHIKRLNAAQRLTVHQGKISINKYWNLDHTKEIRFEDPQEYIDRFLMLFKEAIRCRLRSAYPIGTELSGGLDSSGITCLAAELMHAENRELSSFSYGLTAEEAVSTTIKTEESFADEVIRFAKVDHPVKVCSSGYADFLAETNLALRINDGPHYYTIWHNPVKAAAGQHGVRVLLSGFPGDEMVTNYSRKYMMEYALKGQYMAYFKSAKKELGLLAATKFLARIKAGKYFRFLKFYSNKKNNKRWRESTRNFLSPSYFNQMHKYLAEISFPANFREVQEQLILSNHVSERMEMEGRNALLYKTETRFPMADIRLIEYVLSLPHTEKNNSSVNRYLYRRAMKGLMPEIVINRIDKTTLMQPFILKELTLSEQETKKWLQKLKNNHKIPAYVNFKKLMEPYFHDTAHTIPNEITMKKRIGILLKWQENRN